MKDLKTFRLEVWTDGKHDMCAIRADRHEGSEGLRWIWFVLSRAEIEAITSGDQSTAEDGYHKATIWGDMWMFYDLEMPRETSGHMRVPFVRVEIPRLFLKAMVRLARRVWSKQREAVAKDPATRSDKVEISVSQKHREHVCRLYGQGKGYVTFDVDDRTAERLARDVQTDERLFEKIERCQVIAQNTTRGFHQGAKLHISGDGERGYYWVAIDPRGRRILNGGIIDHGRDGSHDWSIHT